MAHQSGIILFFPPYTGFVLRQNVPLGVQQPSQNGFMDAESSGHLNTPRRRTNPPGPRSQNKNGRCPKGPVPGMPCRLGYRRAPRLPQWLKGCWHAAGYYARSGSGRLPRCAAKAGPRPPVHSSLSLSGKKSGWGASALPFRESRYDCRMMTAATVSTTCFLFFPRVLV